MGILDIFKKNKKEELNNDIPFEDNSVFPEPNDQFNQQSDEIGSKQRFNTNPNFSMPQNISPFRENNSGIDMQLILTKLDLINQRLEVLDSGSNPDWFSSR